MSSLTDGYDTWHGELSGRHQGVLVSSHQGKVTGYALRALEDRGEFFVEPGEQVVDLGAQLAIAVTGSVQVVGAVVAADVEGSLEHGLEAAVPLGRHRSAPSPSSR